MLSSFNASFGCLFMCALFFHSLLFFFRSLNSLWGRTLTLSEIFSLCRTICLKQSALCVRARVHVHAHRSLFWLCFVLCLLTGYVFQFGEIAYETVHYYYYCCCCCQAHHCGVFVPIHASWQILVIFCPLTWNQQRAPACEDSARRCSRRAQMPSSSSGVSGPACRTNCKRKQLFLLPPSSKKTFEQ